MLIALALDVTSKKYKDFKHKLKMYDINRYDLFEYRIDHLTDEKLLNIRKSIIAKQPKVQRYRGYFNKRK